MGYPGSEPPTPPKPFKLDDDHRAVMFAIQRYSEKVDKALHQSDTKMRLLSKRVESIEGRCALEKVESKSLHASIVKLEGIAERLARVEGRQEGMLSRVGKGSGLVGGGFSIGVLVWQILQGYVAGPAHAASQHPSRSQQAPTHITE